MPTPCSSLIDQPDGAELAREVYGRRLGLVPYIRPGFGLAKARPRTCSTPIPKVEGLILDKHGIFTFGASAREAYERMIEMVTLAEERLQRGPQGGVRGREAADARRAAAPRWRRSCAAPAACTNDGGEGAWRRLILDFRGERGDAAISSTARSSRATRGPAW